MKWFLKRRSLQECLKAATTSKKAGDLDGAVELIEEGLRSARMGTGERPQALKKKVHYLLLAKKYDEAFAVANQMIEEAKSETPDMPELIGTHYHSALNERARVLRAQGKPLEGLLDNVRAAWHWQQAMALQGRTGREHTPARAAEALLEALEGSGLALPKKRLRDLVTQGLTYTDPEMMVNDFRFALSGTKSGD